MDETLTQRKDNPSVYQSVHSMHDRRNMTKTTQKTHQDEREKRETRLHRRHLSQTGRTISDTDESETANFVNNGQASCFIGMLLHPTLKMGLHIKNKCLLHRISLICFFFS